MRVRLYNSSSPTFDISASISSIMSMITPLRSSRASKNILYT